MHVCVHLCACLLVNVRELVEVGGEGWLCVALTAPLHIKRLVPSGDLLAHNTAARAYVVCHDGLVLLCLFSVHCTLTQLFS